MSRMIFVNLPVQDLDRSVAFFRGLGFTFNEQFTDRNATCMEVSDQACADAAASTEAILAVSARSREEVDTLVDRALELGGAVAKQPSDDGFMYGRSFYDPDGHAWEVMWMDPAATG